MNHLRTSEAARAPLPLAREGQRALETAENRYYARLLKSHGVTLKECVEHYVANVVPFNNSPTIRKLMWQYEALLKHSDIPQSTLYSAHSVLEMLAGICADLRPSEVRPEHIARVISGQVREKCTPSAITRKTRLGRISPFFEWCIKHGHCVENPCRRVDIPRIKVAVPRCYSIEQVRLLLTNAGRINCGRAMALGLFAGLRPHETIRLHLENILLQDSLIRVPESKTRPRAVKILAPLNLWLPTFDGEPWPSWGQAHQKQVRSLFSELGITPIFDGLRHSFASYAVAKFGKGFAAEMLGHRSLAMVSQHYDAMVTQREAEQFFALNPADVKPLENQQQENPQ